jgi:hypothetical protein
MVGVKEVIVGGAGGAVTVNGEPLVAGFPVPPETEMVMFPVVAAAGTTAVSSVFEAEVTLAATPLN